MNEKRNRNGARGRAPGDDDASASPAAEAGDTIARKDEAPARVAQPPAEASPARRGGALGRIVLLLLALAVAALLYRYWGFWESAPPAQADLPPPAVTVAKPLIKEMEEWSDFTGQFEPLESVEVRARVSGYLESVNFTDGQIVEKG